jgi:hypothetical protein
MAGVRRREIAWFFALFCLSVLVRLQLMNRPLSFHHEFLTAWHLRSIQIWYESGAAKYRFVPVASYDNDADRNIPDGWSQSPLTKLRDTRGNYHYVSYPPLSWIVPFLTFKLLHVRPDVLPLQIFNLGVHLVCAYVIFCIIALLAGESYRGRLNTPALVGAALYMFAPSPLWFHSNSYSQDLFAQAPFALGIYLFLRFTLLNRRNATDIALLGLVSFIVVYADWIGALFGVTVGVYCLARWRERRMLAALAAVTVGVAAALGLIIWQYSQVAGFHEFVRITMDRYLFRSGIGAASAGGITYTSPSAWLGIARHYATGYLPVIVLLFILAATCYSLRGSRSGKETRPRDRGFPLAFYLSAAPVLLHHLILFNFTAIHDFSALKSGILFSLLAGFLYHRVTGLLQAGGSARGKALVNLTVAVFLAAGVAQYTIQNHLHDKDVLYYKTLGETIALTAKKNEVIFVRGSEGAYCPEPQLMWYAHRNIASWDDEEKARALIGMNGAERGIIFDVNNPYDPKVLRVSYIYPGRTGKCADISTH